MSERLTTFLMSVKREALKGLACGVVLSLMCVSSYLVRGQFWDHNPNVPLSGAMVFCVLACVVAGGIAGAFGSIGGHSYAGALLVGTVASLPTSLGYWYFVARSQLGEPRQAVEFVLTLSVCFGATLGCSIYAGSKRYKARAANTHERPAERPPT